MGMQIGVQSLSGDFRAAPVRAQPAAAAASGPTAQQLASWNAGVNGGGGESISMFAMAGTILALLLGIPFGDGGLTAITAPAPLGASAGGAGIGVGAAV